MQLSPEYYQITLEENMREESLIYYIHKNTVINTGTHRMIPLAACIIDDRIQSSKENRKRERIKRV